LYLVGWLRAVANVTPPMMLSEMPNDTRYGTGRKSTVTAWTRTSEDWDKTEESTHRERQRAGGWVDVASLGLALLDGFQLTTWHLWLQWADDA
jgi:hypothetical protein